MEVSGSLPIVETGTNSRRKQTKGDNMHRSDTRNNCTRRLCAWEPLESRLLLSIVPPTVTDVTVSSTQWSESFLDYLETSSLGSGGYSIPVGSSAQSNTLPWIDLDQVRITFSEDVNVQANDLSITGVVNTTYAVSHFFYDPQTKVATWTLETPITAGERLHLDLDGDGVDPVQDLDGNILDGEWVDQVSTYQSGDGTAGGDFEFRFNVLEGDAIASNLVDYFDYIYTRLAEGYEVGDAGYNPFYDVDGNGAIETADWQEVLAHLWSTLPSGTPPGVVDDAPTTIGFDLVQITDRDADVTISLYDVFDDLEDSDADLTYSISGNTNPELFDIVSIDSETGILKLNAAGSEASSFASGQFAAMSSLPSGRSIITITATDTNGLSVSTTLTADIDYQNQAPVISDYLGVSLGSNVWAISGTVTDADDDVEGLIVELSGVFDARVAVQSDGTFYFTVILSPAMYGWESAITVDQHGTISNSPDVYIGLT